MRRVFQAQFVCRRERRTQFVIKLPVFKESSYLYNNFVCWDCAPELYLEKTTCLSSPRFAWILSNMQKYFWIFDQFRFFLLLVSALIFWLRCLRIALYSLFGQPELCLIFILSKNNDFQSGVLLRMPPSSPSMEEFDLNTQK